MSFSTQFTYDIAYALMARDGRQEALFGNCAPLAREAFAHSCPNDIFPELWFELPLMDEPWFDLHALTSRTALTPDMHFAPEETGGHPELFAWFAGVDRVRQLALSFDVHTGDIDNPAVQLLVRDPKMHEPFLALAGGETASLAYRSFADRLPKSWFPCYSGIFPSRRDMGVRVECIPSSSQQAAYASDPTLLEQHLRQVGLTKLGDTIVERCQTLAGMPFQFEFQFNVRLDGSLDEMLGASVRFSAPGDADHAWQTFDPDGAAGTLMGLLEDWGLADDRWRLLPKTAFAKRFTHGGASAFAYSFPAFIKLRWREGEPLDAKTYLIGVIE